MVVSGNLPLAADVPMFVVVGGTEVNQPGLAGWVRDGGEANGTQRQQQIEST